VFLPPVVGRCSNSAPHHKVKTPNPDENREVWPEEGRQILSHFWLKGFAPGWMNTASAMLVSCDYTFHSR